MVTAVGRWVRRGNAIVLADPVAEEAELAFEAAPSAGLGVRWVQEALTILLGRGLAVDGIPGPQTRGAITRRVRKLGGADLQGVGYPLDAPGGH
jgi:peptidoglycan hydrolase-like protein with peptidoglycan-binding domain